MLTSLNIKNISLISSVELDFSDKFNLITGETGSGKSILLDTIAFCLGSKNTRIKAEDKGSVSLEFDITGNKKVKEILTESDIDFEDNIIIRRSVSSSKSQIYINDSPVSSNLIKILSEYLVESYRQNDFTGLLDKKNHMEILDEYADLSKEKAVLSGIFRELKELKKQIEENISQINEREKEKDFLQYAINELEKFSPEEGEEAILFDKKQKLSNQKKILEVLDSANQSLESLQITRSLLQIQKSLGKLTSYLGEEKISTLLNSIESSITETDKIENEVSNLFEEISSEENNLDEIEERLFTLREFSRKYNTSCDGLPNLIAEFKQKLLSIKSSDENLKILQRKEKEIERSYLELAEKISAKRKQAGEKLEKEVSKELPILNMKGAKFKTEILEKENKFSANGFDEIIFKVSTNPGQDFAELAKVASGGETSRVMLALKIALSNIKSSSCLIFDEIDAGIGGATADLVGERIKSLSKNQQVICITHSPQMAAKADSHILVSKLTAKNTAEITARKLSKKESDEEIARMIAGVDITKEARAAAVRLKR